jgi:large subunit ribosomal protein L21
MYAIVEHSGCQFKVSQGDTINIDLTDVADDAKTIDFDKVLMVGGTDDVKVGQPYIDGAKVVAKFNPTAAESMVKGQKLYPTYRRRRKNSSKKIGHRQKYLQVTVDKIQS